MESDGTSPPPPPPVNPPSPQVASPAPRLAPPTTPGPITLPRRPIVWPEWIGTFMLVLGIASVGYALFALLATPLFKRYMPEQMKAFESIEHLKNAAPLMTASNIVSGIIGLYTLYVGYLFLRRRASCAPHARRWSYIMLAYYAPATALFGWVQYQQTLWMADRGMVVTSNPGSMWLGLGFNLVFFSLYLLTPPVFLLIWFRLRFVRERIEYWKTSQTTR